MIEIQKRLQRECGAWHEQVFVLWDKRLLADHGGCLDTARSTSGWNVYLSSPDGSTHALIDWASRRQQSTAKSTGEAETVAGAECLQSFLPILDVVETVVGSPVPCALLTDSDAARAAMKNGYSRKMRYLKKTQRICLGFIGDAIQEACTVERVDTDDNDADVHTKPLARQAFHKFRSQMGVCDVSCA